MTESDQQTVHLSAMAQRNRELWNLLSADIHVDITVLLAAHKSNTSALSQANESCASTSFSNHKLPLELPCFPSTVLAAGFQSLDAEPEVSSSFNSDSLVA